MSRVQELADCILSDQVPASRVPALVDENPGLREELQRRRDAAEVRGLPERLRGHVLRLANTPMKLALKEWGPISRDILRAADGLSADPLAWLAQHQNCELSHHYGEEGDEPDEWRVHRVNGGRNDREWTLIGRGATPADALAEAMRK